MDIDLQWGGYYSAKDADSDQFSVFRLLDFNRFSYQVAIFKEKFDKPPSLKEVSELSPYIGHAPIDSRALLRYKELYLLGGPPLKKKELDGYRIYLEHQETPKAEIKKLFKRLISFSKQPPLKVTLTEVDGEMEITERQ